MDDVRTVSGDAMQLGKGQLQRGVLLGHDL